MPFWDFIFPHKLRDKRDREGRRATKEAAKRRKASKEKQREPQTPRGSSEAATTTTDTRGSLPKTDKTADMLEETSASAVAGSEEPVDPDKDKSWEYDDTERDAGIGQKIKDIADQSVRRVRKIGSSTRSKRSSEMRSRPIKEKTLDRFMERVKARQESRVRSAERVTRDSECVFPNSENAVRAEVIAKKEVGSSREKSDRMKDEDEERKSSSKEKEEEPKKKTKSPSKEKIDKKDKEKKKKKKKKKEEDGSVESTLSTRSDKSEKSSRRKSKPSPLKQIQKIFPDLSKKGRQERKEKNEQRKKEKEETIRRKSREKNLFMNGKPFWVAAGKMSAAEKAEMTQDDLPLNAAIILEVRKGNIDLPVLPNSRIKFDPWAPLNVLVERDETLFNHKMLFANTIRSMINSADYMGTEPSTGEGPTGDTPPEKERHRVKRIHFGSHPTSYWNYDRSNPSKVWREPYQWTGEGIA